MNSTYLLSVFMVTYNQEKYISQAIESALMQRTDFEFEIVIGEDFSTDNTREIVLEYERKYPGKIKVVKSDSNVGAVANAVRTLSVCSGRYIAFLEGDDYWTSPDKLQKQVDFLEANPDFTICWTKVFYLEPGKEPEIQQFNPPSQVFTAEDLAEKGNFIFTVSAVYRNSDEALPPWFSQAPVGDYPLHMLNAVRGKIYYMPEPMAVYRKFIGIYGSQTALKKNKNWYKTLELMIGHFEDEKIVNALRKHQAHSLLFMYNNGAIDDLNESDPRLKDILDIVVVKSPDQLVYFKTKILFLALWKKLLLVLRHNPVVNKIIARKITIRQPSIKAKIYE